MKKTKVKKIKKIPKYSTGTFAAMTDQSGLQPGVIKTPAAVQAASTAASKDMAFDAMVNKLGSNGTNGTAAAGGSGFGGKWGQFGAAATAGGKMLMNAFGINDNSSAGVTLNKAMEGAEIGGAIMPGWGHFIGGVAGGLIGGLKKAKFDESKATTTGDPRSFVQKGGILNNGNFEDEVRRANTYQNSLVAAERTSQAQLEWANDPANQSMVFTAKDGGIVPRKVKAKISKGELYYNPRTKTLTRVPGSPDKPNTDDDVTAFLETGGIVTPHSEETLMINGKTQAQVFAPMADKPKKKMSKGTIEARDLGIKNMAILNELTKPSNRQNYDAVYAANGEILEKFKAAIPYIQLGGSAIDALKKEKPETVRLSKPHHKSAPVYVNPYNQLQDIMLGQALSNYNISQSGYTGGQQLSAKIASASDFAKQRAKVYQWKEEQQNANIARNIAEYNKHSNIVSDIENKEIDLNAANRAAADNINLQNRQAFYKNVGMYGRDQAGWDSNAALVAALYDLGEYGYSNWGEVVKQLKKVFRNGSKQVS